MASKKVTELTKVTTAKNQALFYLVDPTRAVGDQSTGINKSDLKASLSADTTVISGGMVWVSGLTYESDNLSYSLNGIVYTINDGTQVTLDAAPSTPGEQRIDLIYGDNLGAIAISKGTASSTPVANTLAFDELQLSLVLVDTDGTEPEGVALETVYTEDAGQTAEWDATENTSGARIDLASTLAPITGTKSIETLSGLVGLDTITLVGAAPILFSDFQNLNFNIKLKADMGSSNTLAIVFYDSSTLCYAFFGYNNKVTTSDITNVQDVTIFKNELIEYTSATGQFDKIEIVAAKPDATKSIEFILDDIYINTDEGQVEPVSEFVALAGDTMTGALILNADPTNVLGAATKQYVDDTLIEDATVTGAHNVDWDIDTHKYTLTGNTTWTDTNLPTSGTNTKVIVLKVTGNYSITYPANWTTNQEGTYDGTVNNLIVVLFVKTGEYWLKITQPD